MNLYAALGELIGQDPFFTLLEHAGTFAGAISGVRLASIKRFDWFGAYVIGLVTALGGGTLRDIQSCESDRRRRPVWEPPSRKEGRHSGSGRIAGCQGSV